ncbi:sugar phosphate nucleotidyltransferase [Konateibacter massiliensis]|uniref:sugar phosphate nucleotidyltransferase n=1 Tax=Konateibacter massiliensis TaxID=2002841 RepID=UPI000C14CFD6|nr:sugar phosphate nucleotidyltransferase [Konateibacter massiliensis]
MNSTTLVIMAAGIGSRFGGGIKQLEPVGPSGEIIMDYSIYDAIEAGFDKVVFIIRKDLEKDFKEIIGRRMEKVVHVEYAFQELDDIPTGFEVPAGRTKPWGTGQAILACKDIVSEPFAVINADDYYGKEAFVKIHDYLVSAEDKGDKYNYCMAGFILGNTLSDNGAVTRGVCSVNSDLYLVDVEETSGIEKVGDKAIAPSTDGTIREIDKNSYVSMNMWGFLPSIMDELETGFSEFLKNLGNAEEKKEYLLPIIIDNLIKSEKANVKLLESKDRWFGVTYKEDKEVVVASFKQLIADGVYPEKLF